MYLRAFCSPSRIKPVNFKPLLCQWKWSNLICHLRYKTDNVIFMIELFLSSLYFWSWYYITSFEYFRSPRILFKNYTCWNKTRQKVVKKLSLLLSLSQESESLRGIFTKTKDSKSQVAFSLTCSRPWPKRWPPEPPSWSLLCFQDFWEFWAPPWWWWRLRARSTPLHVVVCWFDPHDTFATNPNSCLAFSLLDWQRSWCPLYRHIIFLFYTNMR